MQAVAIRFAYASLATSLCLFGCTGASSIQTGAAPQASCDEINTEINRVYDLTRQRAGLLEVFSYVLLPPGAIAMHDARRQSERSAEQVLYQLLELAQLRSCAVAITNPRMPIREQLAHMTIGAREFECVKPNGVRVYTIYRDIPQIRHRRAEVYSFPPKGPTIAIDKAVSEFPEVVQAFIYERACEAHRQGVRLSSQQGINYSRRLKYNCAAIRSLKAKGILGDAQYPLLLEYTETHEFSKGTFYVLDTRERVRMDDAFSRCFASDDFKP